MFKYFHKGSITDFFYFHVSNQYVKIGGFWFILTLSLVIYGVSNLLYY